MHHDSKRIAFDHLPPKVKDAIIDILEHRDEIKKNALIFGSIPSAIFIAGNIALPLAALPFARKEVSFGDLWWATIKYMGAVAVGAGAPFTVYAIRWHDRKFRREYLQLHAALKQEQNNPVLKPLLDNPKSNFLKISGEGDLQIGHKNPRKLFGIPIGRRHVIKPTASKEKIIKWGKFYLPKRPKLKKRP